MLIPTHPQWAGLHLPDVLASFAARKDTSRVTLLHAWGNVVLTDGTTVWKLTTLEVAHRTAATLSTLAAIRSTDPDFPTIWPTSWDVDTVDLGPSGQWVCTQWPYVASLPRSTVGHPPDYRWLGQTLSRLHRLPYPGDIPRHDPLQWTAVRLTRLADRGVDVQHLMSRLRHCTQKWHAAFPQVGDTLIHGDVHWDQVVRTHDGSLLLLDFENAARGPAAVDLVPSAGWLRRHGSPGRRQVAGVMHGYGRRWPHVTPAQQQVMQQVAELSLHTWHLAQQNA